MSDGSGLRQALAAQLAEKCTRHHLVVWDDPARQYDTVVDTVLPDGWRLERYDGSWWDLRRRVEASFSAAAPPKLVVYVPTEALPADPLEEVRRAGGGFKRLLPTLLKDTLGGQLGMARIAELGSRCATLPAAEDALVGDAGLDPVLIEATGAHDAESAIAAIIVEAREIALNSDAADALAKMFEGHVGMVLDAPEDRDPIARALVRHLLLAAIARVLDDEAARSLVPSWQPLTRHQQRNAADLVAHLSRPDTIAGWGQRADRAAEDLRLAELRWDDRLAACDVARVVDELAFREAARRVVEDPGGARDLADWRIARSRWLRWRDDWSTRALADLEAVRAVAGFQLAVAAHPVPATATLDELYRWYAGAGWEVDRAQRLMEGARFSLSRPGLDAAYTAARDAYLAWLDELLSVTTAAAATGVDTTLPGQADTYGRHVDGAERVALVIVDALRLELGHRLAEVLEGVADKQSVDVAVAPPPTITRVGMANLLPDPGGDGLSLRLDSGIVTVSRGDKPVRTVADRTDAYRAAAGRVEDHTLSEWLSLGDDVLAQRVDSADLVIVRAQEIDAAGEAGLAAVRWSQIDATIDALAILITRLAAGGVTRVVATADHGFLALGRPLDGSRVRPAPTGAGLVEHGRVWIGRPATVPDGCTAFALVDFGIRSEESIVVADGMTVFGNAGAGFFHGGIGPQEALVPVVVANLAPTARGPGEVLNVDVEVPGKKVSAEAFSVRVALAGSLFSSDVAVRITAADRAGDQVARLVPGEAVDSHTGTVQLDPTADAILTFLVTRNLDKGTAIQVAVLDAATGRALATTRATIARDLRPEEEL